MAEEEKLALAVDAPLEDQDEQGIAEEPSRTTLQARALAWAREHRAQLIWPAFALGLLLGWLVLGWLVWPVKWTNTDPWDLRPEHQARYITLVAEDYWQSGDVRRAQKAISSWDKAALSRLLAQTQEREGSAAIRQQLAALADALKLPEAGTPLLASLLSGKGVVLTVVLSAVPMLVALFLALSSVLVRSGAGESTEELPVAELELVEAEQAPAVPVAQTAAPGANQPQQEEKKKTESVLAASTEDSNQTQDMLTSLFDDENEGLERLESLSKGIGEVDINDLLRLSKQLVLQLTEAHSPGARAVAA